MYHTDIILQKHLEKLSPSLKKKTIFRIFFLKIKLLLIRIKYYVYIGLEKILMNYNFHFISRETNKSRCQGGIAKRTRRF